MPHAKTKQHREMTRRAEPNVVPAQPHPDDQTAPLYTSGDRCVRHVEVLIRDRPVDGRSYAIPMTPYGRRWRINVASLRTD